METGVEKVSGFENRDFRDENSLVVARVPSHSLSLRITAPTRFVWTRTLLNVTAQFGITGHVPDFRLITH
jgi:hypothetical protein